MNFNWLKNIYIYTHWLGYKRCSVEWKRDTNKSRYQATDGLGELSDTRDR